MNKIKIFLIILIFLNIINSKIIYAQENIKESQYYTNINIEEIMNIFKTNITGSESVGDDPIQWLSNQKTYIVVEKKQNGDTIYWYNTPNLQKLVMNKFDMMYPNGFQGYGKNTYKEETNSIFNMISMKPASESLTGMQKYGFSIPSLPYLGEYPIIDLSLEGVLFEDSFFETAYVKIGSTIFPEDMSIISPPSKRDLRTLEYLKPYDYKINDNTFENWLDIYWANIKHKIPKNLIITDQSVDEKGFDNDGNQWSWQSFAIDTGIINEENSKNVNEKFKEYGGDRYSNIVEIFISYCLENNLADSFSRKPIRQMPYDLDTLTSLDRDALKLKDPRIPENLKIFNFTIKSELLNIFKHKVFMSFIDFAGQISKFTSFINSLSSFSAIENLGIDVLLIYKSSNIVKIIINIAIILLSFWVLNKLYKLLKGEKGNFEIISSIFLGLFVSILAIWIIISPDNFYKNVKNITNYAFNIETEIIKISSNSSDMLINQGSEEDQQLATYWLPYFSIWTYYNTNHTLEENIIDFENYSNENEQKEIEYPNLNGNNLYLWSAIMADSWSNEDKSDDLDSLRVVDHFMAPRMININIQQGNYPLFNMKQNENYNGKIQSSFSINGFFTIILLMLMILIKLFLFYEFMYEIIMLPIYLASSMINQKMLKNQILRIFTSIFRIPIWGIITSIVMYNGLINNGFIGLLIQFSIVYCIWQLINRLIIIKNIWCPRFLMNI